MGAAMSWIYAHVQRRSVERSLVELARSEDDEDIEYYKTERAQLTERRHRLGALRVWLPIGLVVAGFLAANWSIGAEKNESQAVQAQFEAGWTEGWAEGCRWLFYRYSSSGEMYSDGQAFTEGWCLSLDRGPLDMSEATSFSSPESAREKGRTRATYEAIAMALDRAGTLCYGQECITLDEFENFALDQNSSNYQWVP